MSVFLALGFRPFFLLAGFSAVILMTTWVPAFVGGITSSTSYGQIEWHSHEMIFGYTVAVVAGFLLTAVRNWTEKRAAIWPSWLHCGFLAESCRFPQNIF
jgi:uncharacterized protein involved in response to NO